MGGYGNSVVYENKQRRHFHTKVIRVFMGGERKFLMAQQGKKTGKDRGGEGVN